MADISSPRLYRKGNSQDSQAAPSLSCEHTVGLMEKSLQVSVNCPCTCLWLQVSIFSCWPTFAFSSSIKLTAQFLPAWWCPGGKSAQASKCTCALSSWRCLSCLRLIRLPRNIRSLINSKKLWICRSSCHFFCCNNENNAISSFSLSQPESKSP